MSRKEIRRFIDIPNVGKAIEKDFLALGLKKPIALVGRDPFKMYNDLCSLTGKRHDPCVIDVFISAVRYMEGGPPKRWWEFTQERKAILRKQHTPNALDAVREERGGIRKY